MKLTRLNIFSIILIILGLIFRIYHLPITGYYFDIIETQYEWGKAAWEMGIFDFWRNYNGFFDYMPLSVLLEKILFGLSIPFRNTQFYFNFFLKSLNLLTDIVIGLLICLLPKILPIKTISAEKRLLIFAIFIFSPAISIISNIWGQNDSLIALFGLISLLLIFTKLPKKSIYSGLILSIGFWIKQQAILFLPVIVIYLFFQKKFKDLAVFISSFVLSWTGILLPFYIINPQRTDFVLMTVSNREPNTTNGANNLWLLLNKAGDSLDTTILSIPIESLSKILLVIFGFICTYLFYKNLNLAKQNLSKLFSNSVYFLILTNFTYFVFGTKMHSRYLHIALISLFILMVLPKFFKSKIFITIFTLTNIGYLINQLTIYISYEKNVDPQWIWKLLENQNIGLLNQISSWMIVISYILLIYFYDKTWKKELTANRQ